MHADHATRSGTHPQSPAASALESSLRAHHDWLRSGGSEGEQIDFRGQDLSGVDLSRTDLRQADFDGCRLFDTDLRFCKLDFADLSRVAGLLARQVAGADLTGCKLPDSVILNPPLAQVHDLVVSARKTLLVMLLAIGYLWLTIGTTSLAQAQLQGADMAGADLESADLRGAQLHGARLPGAKLHRAVLVDTGLEGVDLSLAIGLSCGQIRQAKTDGTTRLPSSLHCE